MDAALREAIARLAAAPAILVATDFDGVLAPLVEDPMSSRPLPGTVEALRALGRMPSTTVAAVSGRDLETLGLLTGLADDAADPDSGVVLVGSHGAQTSRPEVSASADLTEAQRATLARLDDQLTGLISRHPGTRIERKPAAVVLHTRGLDPALAEAAETEATTLGSAVEGAHVMPGKCVVEMSVTDASKGRALRDLAAWCGATGVYYAGDDVTDERAFAAMDSDGRDLDLSLKVGPGDTRARYRVDSPEAAAEVLVLLAGERSRHTAS